MDGRAGCAAVEVGMTRIVKKPRGISVFRLEGRGVGRVLGALEATIMGVVWDAAGPVTIRDVTSRLQRRRPWAFNTVMTVMNRLVDKGLLARTGVKGSHAYRAAVSRDAFAQSVTRHVATGLIREFGELAVTQFVEAAAREDAAALARLEDALRRRKAARETR